MKTREELNAIKAEYESLRKVLSELTEEEMNEITGGSTTDFTFEIPENKKQFDIHVYTGETKKFN